MPDCGWREIALGAETLDPSNESLAGATAGEWFELENRRTLKRLPKSRCLTFPARTVVQAGPYWLEGRPAGHFNSLTVHPAILVREKRSDHRSNVISYARTTQCGHSGNESVDFRIVAHHTTTKIRL